MKKRIKILLENFLILIINLLAGSVAIFLIMMCFLVQHS